MLKEIRLKNFKCFREETTFPLSTINLLTGINGRGKSTLLQSMLLMKQSVEHNEYTNKLILNGNCVNLGTYEDLQNSENTNEEEVEIGFKYEENGYINKKLNIKYILNQKNINVIDLFYEFKMNQYSHIYKDKLEKVSEKYSYSNSIFRSSWLVSVFDKKEVEFILDYDEDSFEKKSCLSYDILGLKNLFPYIDYLAAEVHENYATYFDKEKYRSNDAHTYREISQLDFYNKIHYTAADRLGSQEFYKKINLNDFISVDKKGENIATVLFELKEELVNEKLYLVGVNKLEQQVGKWLSQIFDTKVEIEVKEGSYTFDILFTINTHTHKPTNVGFGYSYILPIIVSGLIAKEGEIVIIENPEAHLHPKAQSELTKFLAKVASCGVQIFIESHSEHILNGLQVTAKLDEFEITNEDVNILYFHDNEESYFTQIPVKPNGKIEVWKDGFFDQSEKDLDTILGL